MLVIYARSKEGKIDYIGLEDGLYKESYIEIHNLPKEAEIQEVTGQPDKKIEWHGRIGFGISGS